MLPDGMSMLTMGIPLLIIVWITPLKSNVNGCFGGEEEDEEQGEEEQDEEGKDWAEEGEVDEQPSRESTIRLYELVSSPASDDM